MYTLSSLWHINSRTIPGWPEYIVNPEPCCHGTGWARGYGSDVGSPFPPINLSVNLKMGLMTWKKRFKNIRLYWTTKNYPFKLQNTFKSKMKIRHACICLLPFKILFLNIIGAYIKLQSFLYNLSCTCTYIAKKYKKCSVRSVCTQAKDTHVN